MRKHATFSSVSRYERCERWSVCMNRPLQLQLYGDMAWSICVCWSNQWRHWDEPPFSWKMPTNAWITAMCRWIHAHTAYAPNIRTQTRDLVIGLDFWCFLFLLLSNFVLARPTKQNSPHILYGHKWAYSELDDIRTYRKIHMQNNIRYDMAMGADDNSRKQKQNTSNLWRPTTTKYKHLSAKHKVQQWLSFI